MRFTNQTPYESFLFAKCYMSSPFFIFIGLRMRKLRHEIMFCKYKHTYLHTRARARAHMHKHTRTNTHTHTHTHTYAKCCLVTSITILQLFTLGSRLRRGYVLEYLVLNRTVIKRILFKWFKLRWVHVPNKLVK